jgi:hypothetical protein
LRKAFFITLAAWVLASWPTTASAADKRLIGTWKWEHYQKENEEVHAYSFILTFGVDGVVKMEPFYYDHPPDVGHGNYEADGKTVRIVVTKVIPFFKEDEGSVYFEEGETINEPYQWRGGRLAMKFFGEEKAFTRVK